MDDWGDLSGDFECQSIARQISGKLLESVLRFSELSRGFRIAPLQTDIHPGITIRGVAQSGSAPGSGPGGRRFESSRPDHSSKRALLKIMSKGFLYVGVTLTASTEQFENRILTSLASSAKFSEK